MALHSGDRIGAYEVRSTLGAGGMGEVYRATDTNLKRDVAIKVLPPAFANDPTRMSRFQREAETLASLNHPNIAAIYGVEENALVMELVEGASPKGPLPFDEAWNIASQIAAALEYAHDNGIVHRDLKPANVMVTEDGVVKLLDFGLAKAFQDTPDSSSSGDPVNSPTMTLGATVAGTILGTAAYMAPEQAKGKRVDKRADVWAWGVVLYELLTGNRLFKGEDTADTLAQVLTHEPDLSRVPAKVRPLLERCLQKDPKQRLRDIGDAQALLLDPATTAEAAPPGSSRLGSLGWIAAAAMAVVAAGIAWTLWPQPEQPKPFVRLNLELDPPVSSEVGSGPILSPDGSRFVYVADNRLYARRLDEAAAVEIGGTQGAAAPFFSPDGTRVGFYASGQLRYVQLPGGGVVTIPTQGANFTRGGTWGADDTIISVSGIGTTPLVRIPVAGGPVEFISDLDRTRNEILQDWPQWLPGGRNLLYSARGGAVASAGVADVIVESLDGSHRTVVQANATMGQYVADPEGNEYLLYARAGSLFAAPFDLEREQVLGAPMLLADDVVVFATGGANYSVSGNGTLAYQRGAAMGANTMQWLDAAGQPQPLLSDPGSSYLRPRLSPDGSRVAFDSSEGGLWSYDWTRDIRTRLTEDGAGALWSLDGRFVLFNRGDGLAWTRSDGGTEAQLLVPSETLLYPWSFSPDGKRLAYIDIRSAGYDLYMVPIENDGQTLTAGEPEPLLVTPADERYPSFSPDGHWLTYASDESGTFQVYVRAFPDTGNRWQVSNAGGTYPNWSRDGHTIFFRTLDQQVMTANYRVDGDTFRSDRPVPWSEIRLLALTNALNYDVDPKGDRIVGIFPGGNADNADFSTHVTIMFNLFDDLKRREPAQ